MSKRKETKDMQQVNFRLDPETHKTLRMKALEEGISMNDALIQAVEAWLQEHKKKKGGKK